MNMTPSASSDHPAYQELKAHLCEMFQMDRGDLDFGIYRIMNMKRDEISNFLDSRLPQQVRGVLEEYRPAGMDDLEKELAAAEANPGKYTPEYVEGLRKKLDVGIDVAKVETEIYSHLYNFFKRYYSDGDFMSLRRYKEGVYALPYEGEEVKLHWANHDQYYIKTGENLKHYTFKTDGNKRVRFEIVAATTEKNNNKAADDKQRRFLLAERDAISVEGDRLTIRFEFRPDEAKRKQEKINEDIVASLLAGPEFDGGGGVHGFGLEKLAPTDKDSERTVLAKHLAIYTAKFTFDYFIHKDLGGFLQRELDFFIKNEIMHLDDIENENAPRVENYLAKVRAMRKVAHEIIRLLAQIEEFQKKLWLKKKFVLASHYCVTLDHIIGTPAEAALLAETAASDAQREEWVKLFAIDELPDYSTPLTTAFLKNNDKLQVDTRFFDAAFKYTLLGLFDDLDEVTDGVLIHSENFQALSLLQERYREQIKCIYIDPPYNTDSSPIIYKNAYKHSSWLSLMDSRIRLSKSLSSVDGTLTVAINETEQERVSLMIDLTYSDEMFEKKTITVQHNTKGTQGGFVSVSNEYAIIISPKNQKGNEILIPKEEWKYDHFRNWGGESERSTAKNCFYPIFVKEEKIIGFGDVCDPDYHPNKNEKENDGTVAVYPIDRDGIERKWTYQRDSVEKIKYLLRVKLSEDGTVEIEKCRDTRRFKTVWTETKYIAGDHGTKILNNMIGQKSFNFPKSIHTVEDCLYLSTNGDSTILDYFAGSGTTAHAVINLNREDGGSRKYILVEMGEYFSSVTKPRIQKAAYSPDWKNGKPVSRDGVSQIIKYMTLEQYEDTLDNLELHRTEQQQGLLDESQDAYADYMLGYMMEIETAGSASLLNIDRFANPFDYRLTISHDDETTREAVDLIESFNYLLGLKVKKIRAHDNGIVTVEGETLAGEKTLVIWRNTEAVDSDALDEWFKQTHLQGRGEPEATVIYVNGDNNLEHLKLEGRQWDVRLTEEEFKRRMFDAADA